MEEEQTDVEDYRALTVTPAASALFGPCFISQLHIMASWTILQSLKAPD